MLARFTDRILIAGLALLCASPVLLASTPAATFAELDGKPGLELVRAPRFSSTRFALEARDLDQDSDLDIVLRNRVTQQELAWWRNDGRGRLSRGDGDRLYRPQLPPLRRMHAAAAFVGTSIKAALSHACDHNPLAGRIIADCHFLAAPGLPASLPLSPLHTPPLRGPPFFLLA